MPGYHFIILADGKVVNLLPITEVSNGVRGFNSVTVNVAYLGGITSKNVPIDNRTPAQKASMLFVIKVLKKQFPKAIIQGHHDFPGVKKACPSFNAKKEYENI